MNNKLDGKSLDLEQINIQKLKSVFPECIICENPDRRGGGNLLILISFYPY